MREQKAEQRGQEWSDRIRDEEEEEQNPYEETYRDGNAKNECWREEIS